MLHISELKEREIQQKGTLHVDDALHCPQLGAPSHPVLSRKPSLAQLFGAISIKHIPKELNISG